MKKSAIIFFTLAMLFGNSVPAESDAAVILNPPNIKKIKGLIIEVTDQKGHPLDEVKVFDLRMLVANKTVTTGISDKYLLPHSSAQILAAYRNEAIKHYDELLLHQTFDRSYVANGLLFQLPVRALTQNGIYSEESGFFDPLGRQDNFILQFQYLILKPGYYPEIAVFDAHDQREGEWMVQRVVLKLWPEKQAELAQKPWITENITLFKDKRVPRSTRKPLFGEDPYERWRKTLDRMQKQALAAGDRRSAAQLELAKAVNFKRFKNPQPFGEYNNDGREAYGVTGEIWQAGLRAAEIDPTWVEAQATARLWQLNKLIKWEDYGSERPPNDHMRGSFPVPKINQEFVAKLIALCEEYKDYPFIQNNILRLYTRTEDWKRSYESAETYAMLLDYRIKVKLKIAKQYPSAFWFGSETWDMDFILQDAEIHQGKYFYERNGQ